MFDRIATPIIALGLAFLIWLYIRSRDQETLEKNVPVVFRLASNQKDSFEIMGDDKTEIPVSFTGPPSRLREVQTMLRRGEISLSRTVTVPENALLDNRYTFNDQFEANQINVPPGVRVDIPVNRRGFSVLLRRHVRKNLKVEPRFVGGSERVSNIIVQPPEVEVRGPQEILNRLDTLPTAPVDLPDNNSDKEETYTGKVALLPKTLQETPVEVIPPGVKLSFTLKPSQRTHDITDVQIHFLTPVGFPFTPQFTNQRAGTITLLVKGPAQRPGVIRAYVDLTKKQNPEAGLQSEEPINVELPPGYELVGRPPRLPSFNLVPLAGPVKPPS